MTHCHFVLTVTGCWNYLRGREVSPVQFDGKKVPSVLDLLQVTLTVQVGCIPD